VSERTENEINIKQCVTFFATKQRQRAGSQDMWNQQPHLVKIVCRNGCIYVAKTNSQQGAASKKLNKRTWHNFIQILNTVCKGMKINLIDLPSKVKFVIKTKI